MKSVGLITEYNPFHNGHRHHLRECLRVTGAEIAVAVMSGHFLQRGEPALVDKWERTAMALAGGVDLVVELPLPWACNSAPVFADGGVSVLEQLGVDAICFGSEAGDIAQLDACVNLLQRHGERVETESRRLLRDGLNYPRARARVVGDLTGDDAVAAVLAEPNNILGIEYLLALKRQKGTAVPHTIPRVGAGFHDTEAYGTIASATGIRRMIDEETDFNRFVPPETAGRLRAAIGGGRTPDEIILDRLLLHALQQGPERLRRYYQVADGMENRLYQAAQAASTYRDLVDAGKSRHLTRTRVQRLLVYILLGLEADLVAECLESGPLYLHLLGLSEKGERYLAERRGEGDIPLVGNYSKIRSVLRRTYGQGNDRSRLAHRMLDMEIRATRIYTLLLRRWEGENRNLDFFRDVIRTGRAG